MAVALPFVALVAQAGGDAWHGRALIPQEFGLRGVRTVWDDPTIARALLGSLSVAVAVSVSAVFLAWPAARFLSETRSRVGWGLLAAPVLLPPLVLGDGLSPWLLRAGIADGYVGMGIAHLAVAIPYAALGLTPAFGDDLRELDSSAALVGAGPAHRLRHVVLPSAKRHVALSLALGFTVSWSQYGTSLAVGGGTPMLPLVLVPFVRSDPQVGAVLSLLFLVPPVLVIGAAALLGNERGNRWSSSGGDEVARRSSRALLPAGVER